MDNIVSELRQEHAVIIKLLREAKDLCIRSDAGRGKLAEVRDLLTGHFEREARELYPLLESAAQQDTSLQSALAFLMKDIRVVEKTAVRFFKKYEAGCNGFDFVQDFGVFYIALHDRISREENFLLAEFESVRKASRVHSVTT